ncbi:MAG TPA: sensor histidine kinase [Pseudonocardia sp.]|nr:sensor histidine kinase [Pseudonocardia sp.]
MTGEPVAGWSARRGDAGARFRSGTWRRRLWWLLWAAAALAELAVLAPVVLAGGSVVEAVDVVLRLIGGSFAACGLIAWRRRPDSRVGLLMTATGFGFLVSALLRDSDSAVAQTAGHWLSDVWALFFVPLLLTYLTGGRLRTRIDRLLVGAVAVEIAVLAPLFLLFSAEPATLLTTFPDAAVAGVIDTVQRALYLLISVGTAAVVAARWWAASGPSRRAMLPSLAGAGCLLLWAALLAVDLTVPGPRWALLLSVTAWALLAVPLAFLAGLLRSRLARGGLAGLFAELRTMPPEQLQAALARVLHDPAFAVAYPDGAGGWMGADGRPVELPGEADRRAVTTVQRDGVPVAALIYDRSLDDDPELIEAVGGATTLALENRTLQAQAQARLVELQASRERIVTAADAERRRIERNLHDGAQQRLVTLALQLSLIQRRIRDDPGDAEQLVASASDELARSLAELRELARGIHPAALEQGLPTALEALVLRSAVPARLELEPGPRWPQPVEFAAYFVASEALANAAKHADASAVTVRARQTGPHAVIEISDDGRGGADPATGSGLRGLADRVEALGGRFRVADAPAGGTVVTAELPLRRHDR